MLASFLGPLAALPAIDAGALGPAGRVLPFTMQRQAQTLWCWAATAASVSDFYASLGLGQAMPQCEVANRCIGHTIGIDCCIPNPPPKWTANQLYTLNIALMQTGNLQGQQIEGPLDFSSIKQEIDAKRPICCFIDWGPGAPVRGHFNAIVGYRNQDEVVVQDPSPAFGNGTIPLASFIGNYHGGTWAMTYKTR